MQKPDEGVAGFEPGQVLLIVKGLVTSLQKMALTLNLRHTDGSWTPVHDEL